jgi:hypothetical protein
MVTLSSNPPLVVAACIMANISPNGPVPAWWFPLYETPQQTLARENAHFIPQGRRPREHRYPSAHVVAHFFYDILNNHLPREYFQFLTNGTHVDVERTIEVMNQLPGTTYWNYVWRFRVRSGSAAHLFASVTIAPFDIDAPNVHDIALVSAHAKPFCIDNAEELASAWRHAIRCADRAVKSNKNLDSIVNH